MPSKPQTIDLNLLARKARVLFVEYSGGMHKAKPTIRVSLGFNWEDGYPSDEFVASAETIGEAALKAARQMYEAGKLSDFEWLQLTSTEWAEQDDL